MWSILIIIIFYFILVQILYFRSLQNISSRLPILLILLKYSNIIFWSMNVENPNTPSFQFPPLFRNTQSVEFSSCSRWIAWMLYLFVSSFPCKNLDEIVWGWTNSFAQNFRKASINQRKTASLVVRANVIKRPGAKLIMWKPHQPQQLNLVCCLSSLSFAVQIFRQRRVQRLKASETTLSWWQPIVCRYWSFVSTTATASTLGWVLVMWGASGFRLKGWRRFSFSRS